MLPLIPALILLLLQGPANVEKLAHDGGLPDAPQALHQRMDRPKGASDGEMLASLIQVSDDPQLSRALFALLALSGPEDVTRPALPEIADDVRPIVPDSRIPKTLDGFFDCRRSRDGPF